MIKEEEVFKIGKINKPHGVKGEMSFTFTDDIFDRTEGEYLILKIDGILVPFFIEEYRFKSDTTAIIKFEGIDCVEKARRFVNTEIFYPKSMVDEDEVEPTIHYFIGYKVYDVNHGYVGKISDIDDNTANILIYVERENGDEIMIPFHEDLIESIDHNDKVIAFNLPEGMIEHDRAELVD